MLISTQACYISNIVNMHMSYFSINLLKLYSQILILNIQNNMMKKVPRRDFQPEEVVFVKNDRQTPKPAKIVVKSSYGTYKIKLYGTKDQQYASEYMIDSYSRDAAQYVSQTNKKNKKLIKYLKMAQKDHQTFLSKLPQIRAVKICKQEQQQMQDEGNNRLANNKQITSKYEAILNMKIEGLIQDFRNSNQTTYSFNDEGEQMIFRQNSKDLLMKRLRWGIEDIYLDRANQNTENVISLIMDSEIIQPVQYVTTSLYDKIHQVIEFLKKNKRVKLKNYFEHKESLILKGVENYLDNYTVFLRVQDKFQKFLNGEKQSQDEFNNSMQTNQRE